MRIDDIRLLFTYNDWANDKILDAADALTPEQLRAPNDYGWGSLLGLLFHLMEAHYAWRQMFTLGKFTDYLDESDFPDVAAIRAFMRDERLLLRAYLENLGDDDLDGNLTYETEYGPRTRILWHCLWHLANHGTQHRSECAALLTGFGHSPGNLDLTVFLSER